MLFGIFANDVSDWQPINLGDVDFSIDSMMKMQDFMSPTEKVSYSVVDTFIANVSLDEGPGEGPGMPMKIYNISINIDENDTSDIYAIINGEYDGKEDFGTFWFSFSEYNIELSVEGGLDEEDDKEGPVFSRNQNLTIIFKGCKLPDDGSCAQPHNLMNITIFEVFDEEAKMPDMGLEDAFDVSCIGNICNLTLYLENFTSDKYFVVFEIEEIGGSIVDEEMMFRIKDLVLNVPEINNYHIHEQEVIYKDFSVGNDQDRCDNERWLHDDAYNSRTVYVDIERTRHLESDNVSCSGGTNNISLWCDGSCKNCWNFTVSQKYDNNTARVYCILPNGSWTNPEPNGCPVDSNTTYIVSNATHLWIKIENNLTVSPVDMTSTINKTIGDNFTAGGRTWFIRNIGERDVCDEGGCYLVDDANKMIISAEDFVERGIVSNFDCNDVDYRFNVSLTYPQNFVNVQCILYESVDGVAGHCDEGPQNK